MVRKGLSLQIGSGALLIILVLFFLFLVLPQIQQDVTFLISLDKNKIEKGASNVILFTEVTNRLNKPIGNVSLSVYIDGEVAGSPKETEQLMPKEEFKNTFSIITQDLKVKESGYLISARLNYTSAGKSKSEELSLGLEVFPKRDQ